MKSVLLICNYFAPENRIASIRLTKFAKYLREYGYQVRVLAEKVNFDIKDDILEKDAEGIPVTYVENSLWVNTLDKWYSRLTKNYRDKRYNDVSSRMRYNRKAKTVMFYPFEKMYPLIGTADSLLKMLKNYDLYRNSRKYLKKCERGVDVCFSTSGSYFGHFAGNYLKKINHRMKWIADFRDPVYQFTFTPAFFAPFAVLFEWWVWLKSDQIVVVTNGMRQRIPACFRKKAYCITNGYDRKDKSFLSPANKNEKFVISYTGIMYGGMRDVSKIFQVIHQLINEGIIDSKDLEFRYAGTGYEIFKSQADNYHLGEFCVDYGRVSRKQSLQIQAESTMLLMVTWDYKCQTIGIISGKVLEYMLQEKPVIAIINGDVPDNELARIIRDTGIGIAYEQAHDKRDTAALKEYIKMQYELYKKGEELKFEPNKKQLSRFEYHYLTRKLIKVMEKE